jgi:RNA-binding protein YhbY
MIKIKMLKSSDLNKKDEIMERLIKNTSSRLISKTGNTFTIHKE